MWSGDALLGRIHAGSLEVDGYILRKLGCHIGVMALYGQVDQALTQ